MNTPAAPAIATSGLTKHYGKVVAVQNLSLEVRPGEIFGFLGPNGAGKTTTIRVLMDLIRPTQGSAKIFGLDCQRDAFAVKRLVGNLPGELSLYPSLTGSELLTYLGRLRGNHAKSYAESLAARLSVQLDRPVHALSHGNKQKLGLIQALMHRPPLIILDEPTTGLDPLVQQELYAILEEVRGEGRTIFFSSHVLPEVERLCDRVAIISHGNLLAVERIEDLRRRSTRRMEVTFAKDVPTKLFNLPGVTGVEWAGRTVRFSVQSNFDRIVKAMARYPVSDLHVWETTLEDVFLSYYQEGENAVTQHLGQNAAR